PGRIVFVSSGTHLPGSILARVMGVPAPRYTNAQALAFPDEASAADRVNKPLKRYSTSKLCNVLCAYELSRHIDNPAIGVFAIDPGLMPETDLARELPDALQPVFQGILMPLVQLHDNVRRVADSVAHVARLVTDTTLDGRTALYFDGLRERPSSPDSYDVDKAQDLWKTSAAITGIAERAATP
ncbi:MAG: alanine-phosphoribitol ligase, partial [Chloroflexota bacterium]